MEVTAGLHPRPGKNCSAMGASHPSTMLAPNDQSDVKAAIHDQGGTLGDDAAAAASTHTARSCCAHLTVGAQPAVVSPAMLLSGTRGCQCTWQRL